MLTLAALFRHHRGDVFRPDLAPGSDHVRRSGANSASRINSASRGVDARRRKSCWGATPVSQRRPMRRADAAWLRRERLERRSDGPHPACALSSTQCRTFHYRGYAQSSGWPSAQTLFSDSVIIFDRLLQTQAGERIIPIGFSIGAAVAAYFARHRPVTGMILVTPFDSLEAVARDLYWWAPRRAAPPQSHATIRVRPRLPRAHRPDHSGARRPCAGTTQRASGTWSLSAPSTRGTTIFTTCLTSRPRRGRHSQPDRRAEQGHGTHPCLPNRGLPVSGCLGSTSQYSSRQPAQR